MAHGSGSAATGDSRRRSGRPASALLLARLPWPSCDAPAQLAGVGASHSTSRRSPSSAAASPPPSLMTATYSDKRTR